MKIIQYFPDSKGTRFLKHFQQTIAAEYKDEYEFYNRSNELFTSLESRLLTTDIILITAHGTPDYIEGEMVSGEPIKITAQDFHRFQNSFIFAFSCSTADLGKIVCEENKVISYLGFNDIINLKAKTSKGKFETEISNILRKIYNDSLFSSFKTFTTKNYTVLQLSKLISLNLKRFYCMALAMSSEQLISTYGISRRTATNKEFIKCLHADLLTTIDAVRQRITVHGEENFIPWSFIKSADTDTIGRLIDKVYNSEFSVKNIYYKYFLMGYLYKKLNIKDSSDHYFSLSRSNYPDYEPIRLHSEEKI